MKRPYFDEYDRFAIRNESLLGALCKLHIARLKFSKQYAIAVKKLLRHL